MTYRVKVWQNGAIREVDFLTKAEQFEVAKSVVRKVSGPFYETTDYKNVLAPDGRRWDAHVTAMADTYYSQDVSLRYGGRNVKGFVTGEGDYAGKGDIVFIPYRRNGNGKLFPEVRYEFDIEAGFAYAVPVRLVWAVYRFEAWEELGDCSECFEYRHANADVARGYPYYLACPLCQRDEARMVAVGYGVPILSCQLLPVNEMKNYTKRFSQPAEVREEREARSNAFIRAMQALSKRQHPERWKGYDLSACPPPMSAEEEAAAIADLEARYFATSYTQESLLPDTDTTEDTTDA